MLEEVCFSSSHPLLAFQHPGIPCSPAGMTQKTTQCLKYTAQGGEEANRGLTGLLQTKFLLLLGWGSCPMCCPGWREGAAVGSGLQEAPWPPALPTDAAGCPGAVLGWSQRPLATGKPFQPRCRPSGTCQTGLTPAQFRYRSSQRESL